MAGAVILLVLPGLLVFPDHAAAVLRGGCGAEDSGLDVAVHFELIDVEVFAGVEGQRNRFAELAEGVRGLPVDLFVVEVDSGFEVDLVLHAFHWCAHLQLLDQDRPTLVQELPELVLLPFWQLSFDLHGVDPGRRW